MACIRKRRGVWVVDYRDETGIRRTPSFPTRAAAEDYADTAGIFGRRRTRLAPAVDPRITVAAYAERWLRDIRPPALKPRAYAAHADAVRLYIVPALGVARLVDVRRADLKKFLRKCLRQGVAGRPLTPGSVRVIYSAVRALFYAAVDDELLAANPAARLGGKRGLRLQPTKQERQAAVEQRVVPRHELRSLLEHARRHAPAWY